MKIHKKSNKIYFLFYFRFNSLIQLFKNIKSHDTLKIKNKDKKINIHNINKS